MTQILLDLDETILEFSDPFQKWLGDAHGLFSAYRLKDHHNIPKLFNIDITLTMALVAEFHRSPQMEYLEPLPCAVSVLPALYRAGYRFIAITACLNEIKTVERRKANLRAAFGFDFDEVHCIGLVPSKKEALELYDSSIWVDDLYHHAAQGAELGHKSFLIDRPYNRHTNHPDVSRVADWHEIAEKLL
jgi:FMN phosphatase YigB (HAD superfamily)